jgi:hypothetical protein
MNLITVCEINAVIDKNIITKKVNNNVDTINAELLSMGIENTTGLPPSNDKQFIKQMQREHKKLKGLSITEYAQDTETQELYVLIKKDDFTPRNVIRQVRERGRLNNKNTVRVR